MKIFRILIFVWTTILISSCASLKTSDLRHSNLGCVQLPTLEPRVDLNSLESVYTMGTATSSSAGYGTAVGKSSVIGSSISVSQMTKDPRVQDAITIFDREVKDCITNPYGERKGYILCKFASGGSKMNFALPFFSGFFLLVPNILGMPIAQVKTSIDLDIEIYDNNERLIGRYNASGFNKSQSAFYYGYKPSSLGRVSGINAFKMALGIIKQKIETDKERLIIELNKN